jgi:cell division protein ZapE
MTAAVRSAYDDLVRAGELKPDPAQSRAVEALDRLADHIRGESVLSRLFGRTSEGPAGVYLWGGVGRGKSMLLDLAFATLDVEPKRRVHFLEFMIETHARLRVAREREEGDPIEPVAEEIAAEAKLLCFDEMQVTNPADAMILSRLFSQLLELGVKIVTTSNRPPRDLYLGGLNRELFLPFIALIEQHMEVVRLSARADFRLEKLAGQPVWHVPGDRAADRALDEAWRRLTGGQPGAPCELTVKGRHVHVPRAAMGIARFSFHDLCAQPLAASDYLRIAHEFHTIVLDHIPVMDFDRRNEAKRFIILIDTLYDNAVKLVASAAAEPAALYVASDGFEAQEFNRTASRLIEMQSQSYLAQPHGRRDSTASAEVEGIAET